MIRFHKGISIISTSLTLILQAFKRAAINVCVYLHET